MRSATPIWVNVAANLVAQQLAVRYRRAWIGLAWVLLVPLATMTVMSAAVWLVFGLRDSEHIAHILASLLPFSLFQSTVLTTTGSLLAHQEVLRRHSVNRLAFPVAAASVALIEYLIASATVPILGAFLGMHAGPTLLTLPLGLACVWTSALGIGLLGAIGTVYLRDLTHVIQVSLNLLYWMTPVIYSLTIVSDELRPWLSLNPLAPMLSMYSEPLVHGQWPPVSFLIAGPLTAAFLLSVGLMVFRRCARHVVFAL